MTGIEIISYSVIGMVTLLTIGFVLFDRHTKKVNLREQTAADVKEYVLKHVIPAIEESLRESRESLEATLATWWDKGSDSDRINEFQASLELQGHALRIGEVCVRDSDLIALEVSGADGEPVIKEGRAESWWFKKPPSFDRKNYWSFAVGGVDYAIKYVNPVLEFPDPVEFIFIVAGQMGGDRRYTITCDVREYYELRGYVDDIVSKAFGENS